jgi:hypothetical protein
MPLNRLNHVLRRKRAARAVQSRLTASRGVLWGVLLNKVKETEPWPQGFLRLTVKLPYP